MYNRLAITKIINMINNAVGNYFFGESYIQSITNFVNTHNYEQIKYIDSTPVIFNLEARMVYIFIMMKDGREYTLRFIQ